jgi:hypothetical protein
MATRARTDQVSTPSLSELRLLNHPISHHFSSISSSARILERAIKTRSGVLLTDGQEKVHA